MRTLFFVFLAALSGACGTAAAEPSTSSSPWGPILILAQTEQTGAPALWVHNEQVTAAWVGADERGVHHDARVLSAAASTEATVLPLPPVHPYAQQLYPAADQHSHLLWLDAHENGENRLYSALLTPQLSVQRGPTLITDNETRRYAALPAGNGELIAVWSGGLLAEPSLYLQLIDRAGRPRPATRLTTDADWPALVRANDGTLYVFWLRPSDGSLHQARITDDQLSASQPLDHHPDLQPGDRLQGLHAALDMTHLYLFWNITRVDGSAETGWMTRHLDSIQWSAAAKAGLEQPEGQSAASSVFETGFNSGATIPTQPGTQFLSHVLPLAGQFEVLPLAAQHGDEIVVVYLKGGMVRAYQPITAAQLVGLPALHVDQNRYLYLAWAQPQPAGTARLHLASLRLNTGAWPVSQDN